MADEAPDSAELDAIRELSYSAGYALVEARIRIELERRRDDLERETPESVTQFKRGYLAGLRMVLALPQILRDELEAQVKGRS